MTWTMDIQQNHRNSRSVFVPMTRMQTLKMHRKRLAFHWTPSQELHLKRLKESRRTLYSDWTLS